jgi:hypothetical protein
MTPDAPLHQIGDGQTRYCGTIGNLRFFSAPKRSVW